MEIKDQWLQPLTDKILKTSSFKINAEQPQTPNFKPQTLNPKSQTLNLRKAEAANGYTEERNATPQY